MPLLLEPKFCREKREKHEAHKRGRSQHGLGQRPRGSKDLRMLLSRSRKALEKKEIRPAVYVAPELAELAEPDIRQKQRRLTCKSRLGLRSMSADADNRKLTNPVLPTELS
ncbi:hypothetical protein E5288_WYG012934 [Bos mutus]|uniref:Uncharacterized protein n=1 Tax=Bos mutus TaxID=72004 RepID=A0A6B0RGT9_9CETA|nr:hypothetical protein [Bos mutus]